MAEPGPRTASEERGETLPRVKFDGFRSCVATNEPRWLRMFSSGHLLCEPCDPKAVRAGVIFFNNVGTIGMCGHGTIGAGRHPRRHMGKIDRGEHRIETTVGIVTAIVHDSRRVTVR